MSLPLTRTRQRLVQGIKSFIFDQMNLQETINLRERHQLEDSMGFRGQWDEHRRFQFALLKEQGLKSNHKFLELGCGPLTAGIPVIEYLNTGRYVGVDIRGSVLNLAWQEVGRAGLSAKNPRLVCSSSFGDESLCDEQFDYVYSFSVLYHLDDEILNSYFTTVARRLAPNGVCLANVNTHLPSDKWLEFPFIKRTIETYCEAAAKTGLTTESLGEISALGFRYSGPEKHNPLLMFRTTQPDICQ